MARGIHGLPRVSLGARHAQPFYALRVGHPLKAFSGAACVHLLPPCIPHAVRAWIENREEMKGE
jgi:hypothetical protein